MSLQTRVAAHRLRRDDITAEGAFSGYGSVFGVVDSYGTIMMPGCFRRSLESHAAKGTRPKGLWQHDQTMPIISWASVVEDNYGLKCAGQHIAGVEKAAEAYVLMKAGECDGLSIGFDPVESIDVTPDEAAGRYGLSIAETDLSSLPDSGLFTLYTDVDLWEISQVTFQSCEPAKADTVRKHGAPNPDQRDVMLALAARNLSLARLARVMARG